MILENCLNQIGDRLEQIPGLRGSKYEDEADEIQVPCFLLSLPPNIDYDKTMGGAVEQDIMVTVLVDVVDAKVRRKEISRYADTEGPYSIKFMLETGTYTAFDTIQMKKGYFTVLNIATPQISYKAFVQTGKIFGT